MNIWGNTPEAKKVHSAVGVAAFVAIICLAFGFWKRTSDEEWVVVTKFALRAFWTIGTPVWFLYEYGILWDPYRHGTLEEYKHGAETASKIWIAVSAVLAALYAGKDILQKLAGGEH